MVSEENIPNDETPKEMPDVLNDETTTISAKPSIWLSKRLVVTFLIFLGLINMNFMKGNITIAMVEMTSTKMIVEGNRTIIQPAQFKWETTTKGHILNAYAYGGLFSFLLSSLPSKLGGSITYGTIMATMSILTMLVPFGLHLDFTCFLAIRFVIGFLENIAFSSISDIFRHWTPIEERSRLMSFSYNGVYIGAALLHSICGFVAHKWGWSMVFYTTGLLNFVWALTWLILVPNHPSKDRRISQKELLYISDMRNSGVTSSDGFNISTPYQQIFKSIPFWALCFSRVCLGWSLAVIFICLPLFVKDATQKTTDLVGLISSIPSMVCAVLIPLLGIAMDYWKNTSNVTTTKMHKIILGANFCVGGCLLAASAFISDFIVSIMCFTVIRTLMSCNALVLIMVMVHMAPYHSGAVTALTTFWYSLGSILAQHIIGVITIHHSSEDWNEVFFLTAAVMMFSAICFTFYGSSEPQSWSKASVEENPRTFSTDCELTNK